MKIVSISSSRTKIPVRKQVSSALALYKRTPGFNFLTLAHTLHMREYSSQPGRRYKNVICACIASIIDDHDLETSALRLFRKRDKLFSRLIY